MANVSSGLNGWLHTLVRVLIAAAILGGITNAIAQSAKNVQMDTNKDDIADNAADIKSNRAAVAAVPVMQRDIEHIQKDVSKIEQHLAKIAERGD